MPRPVDFLDECCRVDVDEEGEIEGATMFVTFDLKTRARDDWACEERTAMPKR